MCWGGRDPDGTFVDFLTSPFLLVPCIIMCSFTCVPTPFHVRGGMFPLYLIVCVSHTRLNPPGVSRAVCYSSLRAPAKDRA